MNNFHRKTGRAEPLVSTEEVRKMRPSRSHQYTHFIQEEMEVSTFLTTILASKPWQILYGFLEEHGMVIVSLFVFEAELQDLQSNPLLIYDELRISLMIS